MSRNYGAEPIHVPTSTRAWRLMFWGLVSGSEPLLKVVSIGGAFESSRYPILDDASALAPEEFQLGFVPKSSAILDHYPSFLEADDVSEVCEPARIVELRCWEPEFRRTG